MARVIALAPRTIDATIDEFLAACRADNLSRRTIDSAYGYPLRHVFGAWLRQEGVTTLDGIDGGELRRHLERLSEHLLTKGWTKGRPLEPVSVRSYMRSTTVFLAWLQGKDHVQAPSPVVGRKVINVLSRAEINQLEAAADTERDKLIIRILGDTAVRLDELIKLRVGDLVTRERGHYIHVRGKGRRERDLPIPKLYRRLELFARSRPDVLTERLFLGMRRREGERQPLTGSGVAQMLEYVAKRAGVHNGRVNPHLFRHSAITWWLDQGMDPVQVARLAGHSSLKMIFETYDQRTRSHDYDALAKLLLKED